MFTLSWTTDSLTLRVIICLSRVRCVRSVRCLLLLRFIHCSWRGFSVCVICERTSACKLGECWVTFIQADYAVKIFLDILLKHVEVY